MWTPKSRVPGAILVLLPVSPEEFKREAEVPGQRGAQCSHSSIDGKILPLESREGWYLKHPGRRGRGTHGMGPSESCPAPTLSTPLPSPSLPPFSLLSLAPPPSFLPSFSPLLLFKLACDDLLASGVQHGDPTFIPLTTPSP